MHTCSELYHPQLMPMRRSAAAPKSMNFSFLSSPLMMQFWGFTSLCTMPAGGQAAARTLSQQSGALATCFIKPPCWSVSPTY